MYCDSDQASLCWDCDLKVHGANFLVARHSRTLLCQVCQTPTPWSAAGANLGPTLSICRNCSGEDSRGLPAQERESCVAGEISGSAGGDVLDLDEEDLDDDVNSDESGEEEVEEEEDEGENQVVPWSSSSAPETAKFPSSDNFSDLWNSRSSFSVKRTREISSDLSLQESASCMINGTERNQGLTASSGDNLLSDDVIKRPLKGRRIGEPVSDEPVRVQSGSIKERIETIEKDIASGPNTPAGIAALLKLSRDRPEPACSC